MVDVPNLVERGHTLAQAKAIHDRYIGGESIDALISEMGLDLSKPKFVQLFRRLPSATACPYCSVAMLEDLPSKTCKSDGVRIYCGSCNHESRRNCTCSGCRAAEEKRLVDAFYDALQWKGGQPIALSGLTVSEALALYSLVKVHTEAGMIAPFYQAARGAPSPLMPTPEASLSVLKGMLARQVLFPNPARNVRSAIRLERQALNVDYGYFHWLPNVSASPEDDDGLEIEALRHELDSWFDRLKYGATPVQMREVLGLIRDIAVDEAWRVIIELSDSLNFNADQRGGKLEQLVSTHAPKFTPGRFHYFCTKSVREGYLAHKERRANSLRHAINLVPWKMEQLLNRCEAENWDVRPTWEKRLACSLEQLATELLSGNLGMGVSLSTHSPIEIEALMREAGYFAAPQETA